MQQPFRRYLFSLAERLARTVPELLASMDSQELSEWLAYDRTNNKQWLDEFNKNQALEASKKLSIEEYEARLIRLLGG